MLAYYLPEAKFRFYRVIGGRNTKYRGNNYLVQAIAAARADGIDLLNVSNGVPETPDDPAAISTREISKLTRRGLTVVASCGNYIKRNVENPTSPAQNENVIGVSGYEPRCVFDDSVLPADLNDGRYSITIPKLSKAVSGEPIYCGYEDLAAGECKTCSQCRLDETVWDENVQPDPHKGKPDVLAPVRYPTVSAGKLRQKLGTSYATPIVTAAIGRCLNAVAGEREPQSIEFRQKILQTGTDIGAEQGRKLDAAALETAIRPSSGESVLSVD